ncbi:right-handed parallel beta-helix repeat-containing protein [Halorussus salinisoli]|uniref:right-handed parallel beta-helix repeat-containing protein n=1 Tax=Halorussus salinisoli TaxID=2558242 RepID=UPI0010C1ED21|nr:right-handed parallel beta-helix repeat-containing protein [Halorussus salinisoli]
MPDGTAAALVALVAVLGVVGPAGTAAGISADPGPAHADRPDQTDRDATEISGCTTVTEPGVYVLAGDVTNGSPSRPRTGLGACIAIRADDVTLRGNSHTVAAGDGGQPGVVGVLVGGRERTSNVTVRGLTTTGWGAGVAVIGAADSTFRNVSAVNNLGDGFFAERAPGVEIRGGTVRGSNTGVFVRNAPGARLAGLTVEENVAGVSVRNSDGATVERVVAGRNRAYGVGLFRSANATVADSTIAGNGFAGVALSRADDNLLRNLTLAPRSSSGEGDAVGVYLNDSTGVALVGVSVADSPGWSMYATGGSTAAGERVRLGETCLSFENRDVALDSATDAPPLPTERQVVAGPILAVPTAADARLSLSVGYDDAAVERASTTEDTLSLWRFDGGEGWRRVESVADAERNRASATFGNLSRNGTVVALVGEGLAEAENETDAE